MSELSNQQRLEMISDMIHQAKSSVAKGGSKQILLWGWVIAIANFSHYALESLAISQAYLVWLIVFPVAIYSAVLGARRKSSTSMGHIDRMYGQVWLSVGVSIFITLILMKELNYFHNPIILSFAGVGMYVTGKLLRFRPIIMGSIVLWLCALLEWQLPIASHYLVSGIAIVLGYLIPGYLLQRSERG